RLGCHCEVAYITLFTSGVNHYFVIFFLRTESLQSLSRRCASRFAVSVDAHYRELIFSGKGLF
ncbi:hypothetical protein, partial [Tatumella sp. JGM100]|uniref:hypothetical protein n=1 Tax=Tatumella sp. JGM100 TaxID=2799793 RepID=UPI001BAEFAA9